MSLYNFINFLESYLAPDGAIPAGPLFTDDAAKLPTHTGVTGAANVNLAGPYWSTVESVDVTGLVE